MRRDLVESVTVQTKSETGVGTSRVESWADTSTYRALITPASTSSIERGQLLGASVTHTIVLPRGVTVTPDGNRLRSGSTTYRVRRVIDTPVGVIVDAEVFT